MIPDAKSSSSEKIREQISKQEPSQDPAPLVNLLPMLEDYVPLIPDSILTHRLQSAGVEPEDPRIVRLMSIVVQKYISDIANDALQRCKIRTANQPGKINKPKDRQYTLTMEDLSPVLSEYGISVRKPPYFV